MSTRNKQHNVDYKIKTKRNRSKKLGSLNEPDYRNKINAGKKIDNNIFKVISKGNGIYSFWT